MLFLLFLPFIAQAEDVTYPTAPLAIETHDVRLDFTVEVATSDAQHEHGLMFRKNVPDKHGMIFVFPEARKLNFWMKNTLVPLDMIFVDNHGIIENIAESTVPESLAIISSKDDARAVIEVAGGTADHYHIAPGDKVIYSLFP